MAAERLESTYQIIRGDVRGLADVDAFIELLRRIDAQSLPELRSLFKSGEEITIARAPGRLDVMGGIADYSGSLMLELPIAEATLVAVQRQTNRHLRIVSLLDNESRAASFSMPLSDFERNGEPIDYEVARAYFARDPKQHWAAYVAGVFLVLMRERHIRFDEGANILISSRVPEGKGVSSSAALEVATMSGVAATFAIDVSPRDLALLCQRVENLVVGAPCGVMDQMTSACGEESKLLAILCQPAELKGAIQLPDDLRVWGLDSGVRHSVGGGDYGAVRTGAFMGYRIIAELAGLLVRQDGNVVEVEDPKWNGYLANLSPLEFEESYVQALPVTITGREFVERYGGTTDVVTHIDPEREYAVRAPAAHAVYESFRVNKFASLLQGQHRETRERRSELLGELMYQSHASYSVCGLGSEGTDAIVDLVKKSGPSSGLYGAKITGGGSGGTVAILGSADEGGYAVANVARQYAEMTGYDPGVFSGSSPGSAAFGHLVVRIWSAPAERSGDGGVDQQH